MSKIEVNEIAARTGTNISIPSGSVLHAPGHVIQVVQSSGGGTVSISGGSSWHSSHSDTQVSITPQFTSSKIFVAYNIWGFLSGANKHLAWDLARSIGGSETRFGSSYTYGMGSVYNDGSYDEQQLMCHVEYLDSPNTISAITYIPKFQNTNSGTMGVGNSGRLSTITAMEIAQ
tara:strand:- start:176 stop:697 length:522 start_codon:yes stop_codon:yes gene_type:complete